MILLQNFPSEMLRELEERKLYKGGSRGSDAEKNNRIKTERYLYEDKMSRN